MREDELPEGWESAAIADTCERVVVGFVGPSTKHYTADGVPFLTGKNVRRGRLELTSFDRVTRSFHERERKSQLNAGDVVVVRIGRSGEAAVVPPTLGDANCGGLVIAKRPRSTLPGYLAWYLNSPQGQQQLLDEVRGVTRQTLNTKSIARAVLPLPPGPEQERIVAKVEELLARVNAARERLARVPAILKRFRQAVLAAACEGRLTEEWRKTTLLGETSTQLLSRIAGIQNARGGPRSAFKEPASLDAMSVPDTWEVASMDGLTLAITSGSRGWSKYYKANGPGTFIMAQNIRPFRFDHGYRLAVAPPAKDPEKARTAVQCGDILVTIVGANTGDVCRITEAVDQHYVCQSVAYMRPVLEETAPFLELWLNSPAHGRRQYDNWIYGEGRPHLSLDHLRETAVALPPLAEQVEIVRRVEALFKLADAIEKRVAAATARADKLTQAILAKAFRGELVPTEAELARSEGREFEPAAVLLERIRGERAGTNTKGGGHGPRAIAGSAATKRVRSGGRKGA